jgi:predicted phage terminase large subunit-like protein
VYRYKKGVRIYILPNPINERLDFPATIERAKYLSVSLGNGIPTNLYVEDVAYQRAFIQQLRQEGFPAEAVAIEGQDKRARVILISPLIQSGQVLFPRYGAELVIKQLVGFGVQRFDDLLDALTILIMQILKRYNSRFYFLRVNGPDFGVTTPSPKDNNLPSENLKLGLLPERIEMPWKSDEERKKLERELDLGILKQEIEKGSRWE